MIRKYIERIVRQVASSVVLDALETEQRARRIASSFDKTVEKTLTLSQLSERWGIDSMETLRVLVSDIIGKPSRVRRYYDRTPLLSEVELFEQSITFKKRRDEMKRELTRYLKERDAKEA